MQYHLDKLQAWSNKWLLRFKIDKCTTLHVGHRNPRSTYTMNGGDLKASETKKDLGVWVSTDLKPRIRIASVAAKGNKIVKLNRRNFTDIDEEMCKSLYCSLVRAHLEYTL